MMRCQSGHELEQDAILVVAQVDAVAIVEEMALMADVLELLSRDHEYIFKPIFEAVVLD